MLGVFSADTTYAESHSRLLTPRIPDAAIDVLDGMWLLAFLVFKLAARRRNVAASRIAHSCFDACALKRPNECVDTMLGSRLERGARNIIEGQQIHVGGNALAEIDKRLQVIVVIVEAFDK